MSTSPYSLDLREKVINFIKAGNSQKEASQVFGINKTTINIWHLRYKNEGHCLPKVRLGAKPTIEKEVFIQYVKDHPNARSADIRRQFGIIPIAHSNCMQAIFHGTPRADHISNIGCGASPIKFHLHQSFDVIGISASGARY